MLAKEKLPSAAVAATREPIPSFPSSRQPPLPRRGGRTMAPTLAPRIGEPSSSTTFPDRTAGFSSLITTSGSPALADSTRQPMAKPSFSATISACPVPPGRSREYLPSAAVVAAASRRRLARARM